MANLIKGECKECGALFEAFPSRKKIFCSVVCQNKARIGVPVCPGMTPWNKGLVGYRAGEKHHFFGKKRPELTGANNYKFKGEKVKYRALHSWVERMLGKPHECEQCGNTGLRHRQYHWANVSRNYQRVITDWVRLCVKCHRAFDAVVN